MLHAKIQDMQSFDEKYSRKYSVINENYGLED
jgi:hypothetical protein